MPAGPRRARTAGEVGELAVGHGLAPPDLARQRLEREAPESLDAFEIERDVERVALAREPVVELARDRAVGRADLAVGLVVAGQADLAHAAFGDDDRDLAERAALAPQLHVTKLSPQLLGVTGYFNRSNDARVIAVSPSLVASENAASPGSLMLTEKLTVPFVPTRRAWLSPLPARPVE